MKNFIKKYLSCPYTTLFKKCQCNIDYHGENNHKKVMVEEKFEKYSSIKWVDKTSPKWETLENIYNILDTVGMPLECISFPIWRISSAVFVSCVIFKYRDEIAEL